MSEVSVKVDASVAIARVRGMIRRTANQVVPLEKARLFMQASNAENFASNGLPVGGWAPLSPQYGTWKALAYPARGPLVRTGRLLSEMTSLRGQAFEVESPTSAVFRLPNVEYAKFHQFGTRRMPKRQILFEPVGFAKLVAKEVEDHILDETTGAGRIRSMFR